MPSTEPAPCFLRLKSLNFLWLSNPKRIRNEEPKESKLSYRFLASYPLSTQCGKVAQGGCGEAREERAERGSLVCARIESPRRRGGKGVHDNKRCRGITATTATPTSPTTAPPVESSTCEVRRLVCGSTQTLLEYFPFSSRALTQNRARVWPHAGSSCCHSHVQDGSTVRMSRHTMSPSSPGECTPRSLILDAHPSACLLAHDDERASFHNPGSRRNRRRRGRR